MQHTLEWEYAPEYELLWVSAAVGSHRLAWSMNRALGWALACGEDLVVHPPKGHESVHPTMRFEPEAEGNKVTVVLNRVPEGVLARGAAGMDYLVVLHHHELPAHEIIASLRALPEVSFVTALDPESCGALEPLMALD